MERLARTRPPTPRALEPMAVAEAAIALGVDADRIDAYGDVTPRSDVARDITAADEQIVVTGPLYPRPRRAAALREYDAGQSAPRARAGVGVVERDDHAAAEGVLRAAGVERRDPAGSGLIDAADFATSSAISWLSSEFATAPFFAALSWRSKRELPALQLRSWARCNPVESRRRARPAASGAGCRASPSRRRSRSWWRRAPPSRVAGRTRSRGAGRPAPARRAGRARSRAGHEAEVLGRRCRARGSGPIAGPGRRGARTTRPT